jgi:hypothetical protein
VLDPDTGAPIDGDGDGAPGPAGVGGLYVAATTPDALDRLADAATGALQGVDAGE